MTAWYPASEATDGFIFRVRVLGGGEGSAECRHYREPPYMMVRKDGRWFYARTMIPVYSWHEPVEVSADAFSVPESEQYARNWFRAWGSGFLPSGRPTQVRAA